MCVPWLCMKMSLYLYCNFFEFMKQITSRFVGLLFICLISGFILTDVYAKTMEDEDIPLDGDWNEKKRSISPNVPIAAFIENGQLVIKSHSLRSDITIRIMDFSTMVYEETVLAEKTGYILIDLKDNKSGVYTLNLTNQWGDHLYGEFALE